MRFILTYLLLTLTLSAQTMQKFQKGVNVGERSYWNETVGGKEPVIGVNATADPVIANRVNAMHTDGTSFSIHSYIDGLQVYATGTGGAILGAQVNTVANRKLWLDGDGGPVIGPYAGSPVQRFMIHDSGADMTGYVQKAPGANVDLNVGGAAYIAHGYTYAGTPMFFGIAQSYATALMRGMEVGANDYFGAAIGHYDGSDPQSNAQWAAKVAHGIFRICTGPAPEHNERIMVSNAGNVLIGKIPSGEFTASQSGTTITATVGTFDAGMVGMFFQWGDWERGGGENYTDLITAFIDSDEITVERSRTIASQAGNVLDYKNRFAPTAGTSANVPGFALKGNWFTGGTTFTNKPHFLIEPSNLNTLGAWSTAGTAIGVNSLPGFTGNFIDCQLDRTSHFRVSAAGFVFAQGDIQTSPTSGYVIVGRAYLNAPTVGVATLSDGIGGNAMRLTLGGATATETSIARNGTGIAIRNGDDTADGSVSAASATFSGPVKLQGYTVAGLAGIAAPVAGMTAYVTDATGPTYLGTLTGGGAVVCPVFYNGSAWVSH